MFMGRAAYSWGVFYAGLQYIAQAMNALQPTPTTPHALQPRLPRRILVVEDNLLFEQQVGNAIARLGIGGEVFNCATGQRALALLADPSIRLDLALVDLGLPDISGIDVIHAIRQCFAVELCFVPIPTPPLEADPA